VAFGLSFYPTPRSGDEEIAAEADAGTPVLTLAPSA
jgi:hypothetical protein